MRLAVLGLIPLLSGCAERCPVALDAPDSVVIAVDASSGAPSFSWDGGEVAMLDVWTADDGGYDTAIGAAGAANASSTLLWRLQCGYVSGGRRAAIRDNCIPSPVTYGKLAGDSEEATAPESLSSGTTYTVLVHRYPKDEGEGCYTHDDGSVDFALDATAR